jgi:nucleotide-binding universal stress UspA family protein
MTHFDYVLVGVNGSPASSSAIRYAAQEADRLGTRVQLVHVVPNYVPIAPMHPRVPSDLAAAGRKILRDATTEAHQFLDESRVVASLHFGPRIPTLLELAEHAQLVVLGSQRRTALDRLLTASTLVGVAARAGCPVVAVPQSWTPSSAKQSILVAVKSAERSAELVRSAFQVAAERHARLVLVHAWELPMEYDDLITTRVDEEEWAARARRTIEDSLTGLRKAYPEVPVEIRVVHGQPARILQVASSDADLLLLAPRRRGFPLGHLGGTGRALLREGHCPVEVVPLADEALDGSGPVLERASSLSK